MIQERYCSFEVAKLLKEKGFDEPCRSYFTNDLGDYRRCTVEITNRNCSSEQILRPTHQMAIDWLLEEHNIFIQLNRDNQYAEGFEVTPMTKHDIERGHKPEYYARIFDANSITFTLEHFDDFYDCVEVALKYCLTELI